MTEVWTPPTFSTGKVPQVTPAKSYDQKIEGDFPLDQVVIDRKSGKPQPTTYVKFSPVFQSFPKARVFTRVIGTELLPGL